MFASNLPRRSFCIVLLLAAVAGVQAEDEANDKALDPAAIRAEFEKVREILASVDGLPPRKARWVEVQVGAPKKTSRRHGWLVAENADAIELLEESGDVSILSKKKLATRTSADEFSYYDVREVADADFAAYCREALVRKKELRKDDGIGAYGMARDIYDTQHEILLLARLAAWARQAGNEKLAYEVAGRSVRLHQEHLKTYPYWGVQSVFHRFVAHNTHPSDKWDRSATADFFSRDERDPRKEREERLAYLKRLSKVPYRPKHDDTVAGIGHLESLIAEDKAWKEPTKEELSRFTADQKVDYWIYHLRDLNVRQSSQPGMCWVLAEGFGFLSQQMDADKKPNAAVELKKLSYDAVPKLITHLEDGRPTKCVGYWRDFHPESYHILTYGDCCQQIFEAIALTSIYDRSSTSGYPHRDGAAGKCKERAEAWWKEFRKKGEKQVLIEGVALGQHNSDWQADRLIEKYPDAAFGPVVAGLRAARTELLRSNMLVSLRNLKDDRLIPILREEARGPFLSSRVGACIGLLERGHEEAIGLLVDGWKSAKLDGDRSDWELRGLRAALVSCGRVAALDALFSRWREISADGRLEVVWALGDWTKDFAGKSASKELSEAIEMRLAACLRERDEDQNLGRICDAAALALSQRWGMPKQFDAKPGPAARDRGVLRVRNAWLVKQGKEPIAIPAPSAVKASVPAEEIDQLLTKVIVDPGSDEAKKAIARIDGLGLPALDPLQVALKTLKEDAPARKALDVVAARLACTVVTTQFGDDSVARPAEMLAKAESLRGKPLSADAFVEMLLAASKLVPPGASGLRVAVDRDGDRTGMQLELSVLSRKDPRPGESLHLRREETIRLDGEHFHSSIGASTGIVGDDRTPLGWSREELGRFEQKLRKALESPCDKSLQIRIAFSRKVMRSDRVPIWPRRQLDGESPWRRSRENPAPILMRVAVNAGRMREPLDSRDGSVLRSPTT